MISPIHSIISPIHFALIFFVVANWGFSFVVIHVGLQGMPPLLLAALRFALAAVPFIWLFPRPKLPWWWFAAYGICTGVIQFGVAFTAMSMGISAGLASLVIQMNAFFTVLLSSLFFAERLGWFQWLGLGVAFIGLGVIATTRDSNLTMVALLLMLLAALGWASANIVVRAVSSQTPHLFAFAIHGNAYAPLPLLLLSLLLEGGTRDWQAIGQISLLSGASALYLGWIATVTCFGAWAFLIGRYGAAQIAPFSLLVPIFGMLLSAWLLGESLTVVNVLAAILVISGLLINVFGRFLQPTK
jgi:O-acetylserine/cysteine efflux transporter